MGLPQDSQVTKDGGLTVGDDGDGGRRRYRSSDVATSRLTETHHPEVILSKVNFQQILPTGPCFAVGIIHYLPDRTGVDAV